MRCCKVTGFTQFFFFRRFNFWPRSFCLFFVSLTTQTRISLLFVWMAISFGANWQETKKKKTIFINFLSPNRKIYDVDCIRPFGGCKLDRVHRWSYFGFTFTLIFERQSDQKWISWKQWMNSMVHSRKIKTTENVDLWKKKLANVGEPTSLEYINIWLKPCILLPFYQSNLSKPANLFEFTLK